MTKDIDFSKFDDNYSLSLSQQIISDLYKKVDKYVCTNYLKENDDDEYYIRINGKVYIIGVSFVYEEFYYLKKYDGKFDNITIFEIEDVLNNRISKEQMIIKDRFDRVNESIKELKDGGVSLRLIRKSIKVN
jgi:hypothetical protein